MPTQQLKTWAKEAGKSLDQAEACWESAKKQAHHAYPDGESDPNFWPFVNKHTQICLKRKKKK